MAAPSVRGSKWPQLRQQLPDFAAFLAEQRQTLAINRASSTVVDNASPAIPAGRETLPNLRMSVNKKTFHTAQTSLPAEVQKLLTEDKLKKIYKKAGTESNQRASAATAWLVEYRGKYNFASAAWAGSLRACGAAFFRSRLI